MSIRRTLQADFLGLLIEVMRSILWLIGKTNWMWLMILYEFLVPIYKSQYKSFTGKDSGITGFKEFIEKL